MSQPRAALPLLSGRLPAFQVVVAGHGRLLVEGASPSATVADLVDLVAGAGRGSACITHGEVSRGEVSHGEVSHGEVSIDGRAVVLTTSLQHSGIRHGSCITLTTVPRSSPVPPTGGDQACELASGPASGPVSGPVSGPASAGRREPVCEAVWVSGPDAGACFALAPGRHHVGRARSAAVRCDDPSMELHHAVVDVDDAADLGGALASGGDLDTVVVTLHQLAGVWPVVVDGGAIEGSVAVGLGSRIEIGASMLLIRAPQRASSGPGIGSGVDPGPDRRDPWRTPHVRAPRPIVSFTAEPITAPRTLTAPAGASGVIWPTLIAVAAAAGLAVFIGELMFLLFGLMGAVVAFGTWLAQKIGAFRSRSRRAAERTASADAFAAALAAQRARASAALSAGVPTIESALSALRRRSSSLWAVRARDADAFRASIGEGEGFWQPVVSGLGDAPPEIWGAVETSSRLGTVPIAASLGAGSVMALAGDRAMADAVARSMILQLAASSGPADWRLIVISDRVDAWQGLDWLGHIVDSDGTPRRADHVSADALLAGLAPDDERHLVVVLDGPELLRSRTSAMRRLMARTPSLACIVLCASEAQVPAVCTSMLVVGGRGRGRWTSDTTAHALAEPVHVAGISVGRAVGAARAAAHLVDPEHVDDTSLLPATVGLAELLDIELGDDPDRFAHCIADRWTTNGTDPPPSAPIGRAADGVVEIDLERDGPHGLLAGTTGAGKSELLRSLVLGLAVRCSPDHLCFVLVDYKGGATFDGLAGLPHVVGLVTDLDDRLAARALRSLEAELRRREHLFRDAGVSDLASYRIALEAGRVASVLPRLAVVIDEFAGLVVRQPDFMGSLLGIAQRGRSLGVHLLLATQRPAGVVSDDIRANTQLRIALRVHDTADALDVIGDPAAARLPRAIPGRAIMRLGADDHVTFQTARCSLPIARHADASPLVVRSVGAVVADPLSGPAVASGSRVVAPTELDVIVAAIRHAARIVTTATPHRPWLAPLAAVMSPDGEVDGGADGGADGGVDGGADGGADGRAGGGVDDGVGVGGSVSLRVGVVDDPDHQRRTALLVPSDGHLALVGSVGCGLTSTLLAIATAFDRGAVQLFVIDAIGDVRHQSLGGDRVIRLHERERVLRLLAHLAAVIDSRAAADVARDHDDGRVQAHNDPADVVLLIDGYGALRSAFERDDEWARLEQLDRIVADGAACGVRVVLAATRAGAVPAAVLAHVTHRWVFHLTEPLDASLLGVSAASVPPAVPGRLVVAETGLEAQVFIGTAETPAAQPDAQPAARVAGDRRSTAIIELPCTVSLADLPDAVTSDGGDVFAPVGIGFDTLGPALLPIAAGEHVLVIGPQRSGRTTALLAIARCWQLARSDGWIGCLAPRRGSVRWGAVCADVEELVASVPDDRPALLVIDDAELVDDVGGRLGALVAGRAEHVTIVAAARPEALRASYGHWTAAVRRSRLGLVMAACTDLDADLLGAVLPRRAPIRARPGLAWLVAEGGQQLVQIAQPSAVEAPNASLDAIGVVP